jgi:hypothetical protein
MPFMPVIFVISHALNIAIGKYILRPKNILIVSMETIWKLWKQIWRQKTPFMPYMNVAVAKFIVQDRAYGNM